MTFKVDAAKIRRWREERHWSQEHLADLAGIGLRTIQRIENGDKASQESAMALAAAFGVDATTLSVDIEDEARKATALKAEEAEARARLHFYFHTASVVVVVAIFGMVALMDGDWGILKISLLFAVPLLAHGVSIVVMQLSDRHERRFGNSDAP
ncbi:MAG: helix-turn-helix transcriptional regulator [Pseudomonadota bacterium]